MQANDICEFALVCCYSCLTLANLFAVSALLAQPADYLYTLYLPALATVARLEYHHPQRAELFVCLRVYCKVRYGAKQIGGTKEMDAIGFGEWLFRARRRLGLRQEQVGDRVGRTKSYISALERAKPHPQSERPRLPPAVLIDRLADVLNVDADVGRLLMGYAPRPPVSRPAYPLSATTDGDPARLLASVQRQLGEIDRAVAQMRHALSTMPVTSTANTMPVTQQAMREQKPLSPSNTPVEQEGALDTARDLAQEDASQPPKTRILAVANVCPRTAKTLSAASIAAVLAQQGATLLIDSDPRGELSIAYTSPATLPSLRAVWEGRVTLADAVAVPSPRKWFHDLLPAGADMLAPIGVENPTWTARTDTLRAALQAYAYVVIDTPSAASEWLTLALRLATDVLVPLTYDPRSLVGAQVIIERLAATGRQTNLAAVLCRCGAEERTQALRTSAQRLFPAILLHTTVDVVVSVESTGEAYDAVVEEWLSTPRKRAEEG